MGNIIKVIKFLPIELCIVILLSITNTYSDDFVRVFHNKLNITTNVIFIQPIIKSQIDIIDGVKERYQITLDKDAVKEEFNYTMHNFIIRNIPDVHALGCENLNNKINQTISIKEDSISMDLKLRYSTSSFQFPSLLFIVNKLTFKPKKRKNGYLIEIEYAFYDDKSERVYAFGRKSLEFDPSSEDEGVWLDDDFEEEHYSPDYFYERIIEKAFKHTNFRLSTSKGGCFSCVNTQQLGRNIPSDSLVLLDGNYPNDSISSTLEKKINYKKIDNIIDTLNELHESGCHKFYIQFSLNSAGRVISVNSYPGTLRYTKPLDSLAKVIANIKFPESNSEGTFLIPFGFSIVRLNSSNHYFNNHMFHSPVKFNMPRF